MRGLAGFLATLVLSVLMLVQNAIGLLPEFDIVRMLSELAGAPEARTVGWGVHFFIGVVLWSSAFALLEPRLPGRSHLIRGLVMKGLTFGTIAWALMMTVFMPLAGAAFFGAKLFDYTTWTAPLMILLLHWIFGAVLGACYAWMRRPHLRPGPGPRG